MIKIQKVRPLRCLFCNNIADIQLYIEGQVAINLCESDAEHISDIVHGYLLDQKEL